MTLQNLLERREVYEERTARAMRPFILAPIPEPPLDLADEQRRARIASFQNRIDWLKVTVLSGAASISGLFWFGVWWTCTALWRLAHVR